MNMRIFFIIALIFNALISNSQSKNERIEFLTYQLDSIKNTLDIKIKELTFLKSNFDSLVFEKDNERKLNLERLKYLDEIKISLEKKISHIDSTLKVSNNKLNKLNQENIGLKLDIDNLSKENNNLKDKLKSKSDSLIDVLNDFRKFESSSGKNTQIIPENNFDLLVNRFDKKEKNIDGFKKWIYDIIKQQIDGSLSFMTKRCLDYTNDIIDYSWGYVGSIDKKTLVKKWGGQYDLKYANFEHLFENGNCGWATRKLNEVTYLGELNNADWIKIKIIGGCGENDYSNTLIRVVKIIRKDDNLYIDNFLNLDTDTK